MPPEKSWNSERIVPGRKSVAELLHKTPEHVDTVFVAREDGGLGEILARCRELGVRYRLVPRAELARLTPAAHQGVVARLRLVQATPLSELLRVLPTAPLPLLLALDHIHDPGNAGTLARTLYALGGAGLIVPKDRSAYLGGYAAKAAAGALTQLPVHVAVNLGRVLDQLTAEGLTLYGAAAHQDAAPLWQTAFCFPCVLLLGNEERGLRSTIERRCHHLVRIPMARGFDSLNVAQAGAIILGEMARQVLSGCTGGD